MRRKKTLLFVILAYSVLLLLVSYLLDHKTKRVIQEVPIRWRCHTPANNADVLWNLREVGTVAPVSLEPLEATVKKQHIYLHATWRTGSSFLGELFNQHPNVFYLYEPTWHLWQALYPGDAESLQGAVRDMLSALFRCDFSVMKLYANSPNISTATIFGWKSNKVICSAPLCPANQRDVGLVNQTRCEAQCPHRDLVDLEAECKKYPVIVIKDVRVFDLGILAPLLTDPGLNVKVIQLFRDPRAVQNSRLKSKQSLVRESIQVLRSRRRQDKYRRLFTHARSYRADAFVSGAMEVICECWFHDILLSSQHPSWLSGRYTRLLYEDLVTDPLSELARLYRFANLTLLPAVGRFALYMTRGEGYTSHKPFQISSRDARAAIHAWRERMTLEQIEEIENYCGMVLDELGYLKTIRGER
ncbi:carbohydrate sulfotransferase 7 [Protopterus annectens]|uniref:carbohydrate sulfotransferase 7 n=1 Tax=Protopterus annectens TaxID=7888 RepID=UPI001CFC2C84|nr:carbohydrate sulfotransferase 7 [Protopterus annectens]